MAFLVKAGMKSRGRNSVVVATELMVEHPVEFRRVETRKSPIGNIGRSESTGKRDTRRFRYIVREGTFGTGSKTSRSRCQTESPTSAAGTKKVVRVLRYQEEQKLDAIDKERRELYEQIEELENKRDELVREAFSKGHVVRVAALEERAAEEDRIWQERKRILNSLSNRSASELRALLETDFVKGDSYVTERIEKELEGR